MADDAAALAARLQKWADGKATLKEVRGYSAEGLYSIARTGFYFFYQGKLNEARTVFQGLYAVNPMDPYFAKALGVVEMASGNPAGAVAAYDVALKLAPTDAQAWLGRAEVRLLQGAKAEAIDNLRRAQQHSKPESAENQKVSAMLQALSKK